MSVANISVVVALIAACMTLFSMMRSMSQKDDRISDLESELKDKQNLLRVYEMDEEN